MLIRSIVVVFAVALAAFVLTGCGGDDDGAQTVEPTTTTAPASDAVLGDVSARAIEARPAQITVDGDPSDWEGIVGLSILLEPIGGSVAELKDASIRVAYDDEFAYALFTVIDDYNWDPSDAKKSAAGAIMWNVDPDAGPHMGAVEPSGVPAVGLVDIWHWELECALGEEHGGAVHGPGDGDGGNDAECNLDDEWSTSAVERDDDNGAAAENSLLGVWTHTDPNADAAGTWFFELRRPLLTSDEQDAQFELGQSAQVALAYWDPDNGPEGWEAAEHAQSANAGWIDVIFAN
jgi:hypothetical protein